MPAPDPPVVAFVRPSPNHGERLGQPDPDCVILHYTGMMSAEAALSWLCNPQSQVSSHYFVFEDGRVVQLVPEDRRAWHAGKSSWRGETDMNSRSIGIEIANRGHDLSQTPPRAHDYPAFPDVQIEAVIHLVGDIVRRWGIPAARLLAHSDIAPGRKIDPGENFPWERLHAAGLGLWPDARARATAGQRAGESCRLGDQGESVLALQSDLADFGYGLELTGIYDQRTEDVVTAFQRHWRQRTVDGIADAQTLQLLQTLRHRLKSGT